VGAFIWHHFKTMKEILDYISRELSFTEKFNFEKSRELAKEKIAFTRNAIAQFSKELAL
jgi:hypothetical protein